MESIKTIQSWVSGGVPIAPGMWIDEALKLLSAMGEASDLLAELEQEVAIAKWTYKKEHNCSDAEAESYKRTLPCFKAYKKQEGTLKLIEEYVRLAKKRATLADTEMKY